MLETKTLYRSPAYWILGLLLLILIPPMLNAPFGRDQGIFAWVASVMLDGGQPYRDAWDIKGPLIYYAYAAELWVSGRHSWGIYLIDIILLTTSLIMLFQTSIARQKPQLACLAGVTLLATGVLGYFNAGQPDVWVAYITLIMFCSLESMEASQYKHRAIEAGLLLGLCCLLKPHYVLLAPAIMLAFMLSGMLATVTLKLWVYAGVASALVVTGIMSLLALSGALPAFIDTALFALNAHGKPFQNLGSFFYALSPAAYKTGSPFIGFYLLLAFGGVVWMAVQHHRAALLVLAFMLLSFAAALLQGRYLVYQFAPVFAVSAVPAAYLLDKLFSRFSHGIDKYIKYTLAAVLLFMALCVSEIYYIGLQRWQNCFVQPNQSACHQLYRVEKFTGAKLDEVAAVISKHSAPRQPIFLWGADAGLYVLSNRPSITAFGYIYPLIVDDAQYRSAYRQRLLADMATCYPVIIAVGLQDANPITDPKGYDAGVGLHEPASSVVALQDFPELLSILQQAYQPLWANSYMQLYRLNTAEKACSAQ